MRVAEEEERIDPTELPASWTAAPSDEEINHMAANALEVEHRRLTERVAFWSEHWRERADMHREEARLLELEGAALDAGAHARVAALRATADTLDACATQVNGSTRPPAARGGGA